MNDAFYLDLRDKPRVLDFFVEIGPYCPAEERVSQDEWIKKYQEGERVPTDKLAEVARKAALQSWPIRFALKTFCEGKGAEQEWGLFIAALRPSTAHVLERFRKKTKVTSLEELLRHPDAGTAVRDEELQEISHLRPQLREELWKQNAKTLQKEVDAGEKMLAMYTERLRALRDLAEGLPHTLQEEVFSKLRHYEDRIMFAGESVAPEILDEEIAYYTEQKEISPFEG